MSTEPLATRTWAKVGPDAYLHLPLRSHEFLRGVPLHDVWQVRLPGGGPDRTLADARQAFRGNRLSAANPAVRALFAFRRWLGRLFRWDRECQSADPSSFIHELTAEDRAQTLVEPGTADGPFTAMYAFPNEAVSEAKNATVHAFLVYALEKVDDDYVLTWAIHVAPVSPLTPLYMALIWPFRRFIVYPSILKQIRVRWIETYGEQPTRT